MTAFDSLTLHSAAGLTATYVPGAGMVGVSLRDGTEELLGQRRGLEAYASEGKTMGIPLLHPWANRLAGNAYEVDGTRVRLAPHAEGLRRDGNGLPIHGLLAGARGWEVQTHTDDLLAARFDFGGHPALLASFPFPHTLRIEVTLRERTLSVETTLKATGDVAVPVAYGFHPYLRLPGVPRAEWRVELPAMRALALDERGIPTGADEPAPAFEGHLGDRVYDDAFALGPASVGTTPADGAFAAVAAGVADGSPVAGAAAAESEAPPAAAFAVSGGGRRIEVRFMRGFPAAQVFAPSSEDVICFEPMTAPTNALRAGGCRMVAPGEEDVSEFVVDVRA